MNTPRIIFDARMIRHSGIGTNIRGLLDSFMSLRYEKLALIGNTEHLAGYPWQVISNTSPIYSLKEQWTIAGNLRANARTPFTVFHAPHYNVPVFYPGPLVVTIFDIIHLLYPQYSRNRFARFYAAAMLKMAVRKAKVVITGSNNTAKDLAETIGAPQDKIRVIYPGMDGRLKKVAGPELEQALSKYGINPGYILYVGNIRKIKNVRFLVETFKDIKDRLPKQTELVLAGKNFMGDWLGKVVKEYGIIYLGEFPCQDLPALYSGAGVFVFPSLYEGFGLPPLEAMACGCPVIASNRGSLPEILGDAAVIIELAEKTALGRAILEVLDNSNLVRQLEEKGQTWVKRYNWDKSAQATLEVYEFALTQ